MGLKKRFLNLLTDDTAESETQDEGGGFDWLQTLFSRTKRGRSLESITYYSCMRIRCDAIAKLPLKVLRHLEKGGTELVSDNEVYRLLKLRPNSFMGIYDFLFATEFQKLEYGDAFWLPSYDNRGRLKQLYLLDSLKMRIVVDEYGKLYNEPNVYYVYDGSVVYAENAVLHFKNFSLDGIHGTPIKKYIETIVANEQMSGNILYGKYETGMQDPIIVEYIGDLNEARQRQIKQKFSNLGGVKNAGKVVPIPSQFKVSQLSTKMVDNQFFELQGLTSKHISNAFGVKGFQLNDLEKSSYSSISEQNRLFYSDTLQGVLTAYEQEIDYKLLSGSEREKELYSKFNLDAMLRADPEARYNAYATGIKNSFITPAEVRAKEDMSFIPGTDRLIAYNGASVWLDELGVQYEKKGGERE